MIRQIRFELFKMFRKPRTYLGYAVFLLINICIMLGAKYGSLGTEFAGSRATGAGFMTSGSPVNAEFMSWLVVGSPIANVLLVMAMPFYVCLVFGEIFAGEVGDGTLRTVLTRPIRRGSFFAAKFAASMIYALSLEFFLGLSAYLIGWVFFGRGGLMATGTIEHPILAWYPMGSAELRLLLGYALMSTGAITVGMISFFISTWLNNSIGAIGGALVLLFLMAVVGVIPWFEPVRDYFCTTHLMIGNNAFMDPIPWSGIIFSLKCLGVYIVSLFAMSYLVFIRKDVLA